MPGKPLVMTAGEPAGVGPDLCVELAQTGLRRDVVVVADSRMLAARADLLGKPLTLVAEHATAERVGDLRTIDVALAHAASPGRLDSANAASVLETIELAVEGCLSGRFAGLVTGPVQKSIIVDAGLAFSGHTEMLAEKTAAELPVMLLVAGELRVALASTHIPLRDVPDYLNRDRLRGVLRVLHNELKTRFAIAAPRIIVCGLNPHAGEGGHLGKEDDEIIRPVVEECIDNGMAVRGPLPADTAFTPYAGKADAILAMYHDQGLPVLKYVGFGSAVNVTLGLPIVRTSVDHGTALDIAGSGRAEFGSMRAAIELAGQLAG